MLEPHTIQQSSFSLYQQRIKLQSELIQGASVGPRSNYVLMNIDEIEATAWLQNDYYLYCKIVIAVRAGHILLPLYRVPGTLR
jgi:hypothetical protein